MSAGSDLKVLKSKASDCRTDWIHGGNDLQGQLSFVGRALPKGSPEVAKANIETHKKALTRHFDTPHDLLQKARNFARRWATKWVRK